MVVGPSAAPMIPMEAASLKGKPTRGGAEGGGEDPQMGGGCEQHHVGRPEQGGEITHGTDADEDQHREQLVGDAQVVEHRKESGLTASGGHDGEMAGDVGQDAAHPHGEQQHRFVALADPQPDQQDPDGQHDPDGPVSHAHDTGEQFLKDLTCV